MPVQYIKIDDLEGQLHDETFWKIYLGKFIWSEPARVPELIRFPRFTLEAGSFSQAIHVTRTINSFIP